MLTKRYYRLACRTGEREGTKRTLFKPGSAAVTQRSMSNKNEKPRIALFPMTSMKACQSQTRSQVWYPMNSLAAQVRSQVSSAASTHKLSYYYGRNGWKKDELDKFRSKIPTIKIAALSRRTYRDDRVKNARAIWSSISIRMPDPIS